MATPVSICSNALLMLGAETIAVLTEATDRARIAANLYESTRDAALRSHPWNCAVKRVVLSPDVAAPAFGYTSAFTLPADFLRVLQVGDDGYEQDYKVESGKIAMDGTVCNLRYIWRNTTESTWDAMLVKAMEYHMAAAMAYGITKSASMAELMDKKLAGYLKSCRAVDGQDDPPQTLGDFPLLNARFGGGYRY